MASSAQDDGVYTKTSAYNFLKRLVGIKPKDPLNRKIFYLCFSSAENFFLPKKQEEEIMKIFDKHKIPELNKKYWELKQKKSEEAVSVFNQTIAILQKEFKEAA